MHKNLIVSLLCLVTASVFGQTKGGSTSTHVPEVFVKPLSMQKPKDSFPFSWFGIWEGNLEIYNAKGLTQTVPMQLELGATETSGVYKWHIVYGEDREKGLRPYMLKTIDASKGLYETDEMNSIKMESYFIGGRLMSTFSVQGNLLTTIQEKVGETMRWEIIFGKEKEVSITGNQVIKGDTMPMVKTMPIMINQRAILTKKN